MVYVYPRGLGFITMSLDFLLELMIDLGTQSPKQQVNAKNNRGKEVCLVGAYAERSVRE